MTSEQVIDDILRRESSAFSNRPADRGGPTKFGITLQTLQAWRKRRVTARDVEALTEGEAREIYAAHYLGPLEGVPDPLRALLADWATTSWHDDPIKALQISLRRRGLYLGKLDGVVGPMTREAIKNDPDQDVTYRDVVLARFAFYDELVFADPLVKTFLRDHPETQLHNARGWRRRVCEFVL